MNGPIAEKDNRKAIGLGRRTRKNHRKVGSNWKPRDSRHGGRTRTKIPLVGTCPHRKTVKYLNRLCVTCFNFKLKFVHCFYLPFQDKINFKENNNPRTQPHTKQLKSTKNKLEKNEEIMAVWRKKIHACTEINYLAKLTLVFTPQQRPKWKCWCKCASQRVPSCKYAERKRR